MGAFLFCLGIIYASFIEWAVHKYLFHKMGKKKNSFFSFHLKEHHKICKLSNNLDLGFEVREYIGMFFLVLIHLPLVLLSVHFFLAILCYAIAFSILHKMMHSDVGFCKKYFKWHWNHHMENPNKDWNVVLPIWDYLLKTRNDDI